MSARISLSFETDGEKSFSLSIPKANESVDDIDINAAMDSILSANIFSAAAGNLTAKKGAKLTITDTSEVTV